MNQKLAPFTFHHINCGGHKEGSTLLLYRYRGSVRSYILNLVKECQNSLTVRAWSDF